MFCQSYVQISFHESAIKRMLFMPLNNMVVIVNDEVAKDLLETRFLGKKD